MTRSDLGETQGVVSFVFTKVHGLGNDFVLLDFRRQGTALSEVEAREVCDRRRGIGADGVLTLLPAAEDDADLRLLIQNADGSVPEMCGNGLRCVVHHVRDGTPGGPVRVWTDAGLRLGWVEENQEVRVTLGVGRIAGKVPANLGGLEVLGTWVDMGNPHLVLFLEGILAESSLTDLADRFGPELEQHPQFPNRVNVGFARRRAGDGYVDLVVFERGAGRTEACGTGAAACALGALDAGRWGEEDGEEVRVRVPGGMLRLRVPRTPGKDILLAGPTARVFTGTYLRAR